MSLNKENQENQSSENPQYFNFKEVFTYFFRKKDPNRPTNFSLKMMHGINKLSIIMFLIAFIIIVTRFIIRMF